MLCRRAKRTGMGCSHPTSNFTTLCKKKTASAFLHADGFWRRWWVLPRPKNSPLGCFCPAGRKAPGTGCSHPTSNFTTLCKKKTASAFLHADGFWRRWWVLPRPKNSPLGCFCPAGRKAPGTGCSHPTSNFTTLCKKKTASAFLHADGFWRRWWVLPRPKNSPLGCFCPAGRKAPGTGCSHPTSNFTTLCKKKTASAFLHADGFWRRWWDSNPRARLRTKRFRVVLVTTTSIHLHIVAFTV